MLKVKLTADVTPAVHQIKRALVINDSPVTVAVTPEVQDALNQWAEQHADELVAVLAPFGLHPHDIAEPKYRRVVTID